MISGFEQTIPTTIEVLSLGRYHQHSTNGAHRLPDPPSSHIIMSAPVLAGAFAFSLRRQRFQAGSPVVTIVIGLTGGIASGKSVVSQMLAERGALVIDADKVGHEAYRRGSGCYDAVVEAFGPDVVGADGEIDRKALGGKVFGDPAQRQAARRHRLAVDARDDGRAPRAIRAEGTPVVVLEAAVLIEADWIADHRPGVGRDRPARASPASA